MSETEHLGVSCLPRQSRPSFPRTLEQRKPQSLGLCLLLQQLKKEAPLGPRVPRCRLAGYRDLERPGLSAPLSPLEAQRSKNQNGVE